ncbi:MAG TPA: 16S rRNA processing protein RimM [Nitrospirae bacterium]|nr:16S rRNA processing protein RimM [Nitrospirota bacterium]
MSSLVSIGRIVKSRGVKGEFIVLPLTFSPERFDDVSRVHIKLDDEIKEFTLEYSKPYGRTIIMKLLEINSPEEATSLRGGQLMVPEEESPPLPEDVYYYYQIIGLKVFTVDGVYIGGVSDIIETGSNDVYVVRDEEKEYLIPAIRDVIKDIDIGNRRIIISPEAGLLE